MKTIQEFSDDELVDELMARYDDVVIGARRVLDAKESKAQRRRWWKGDMDACLGLIQGVSAHIIEYVYKEDGDG